ncbi:MAG: hypothetical protein J6W27_02510 [Alphaproteobacteria bacterium]|nr:hypothetical protein [Alphaproteobacteria bacterium]
MKRIIPFFVVCLGLSVFQTTSVYCAETVRNTSKRDVVNNIVSATTAGSRASAKQNSKKTENTRSVSKNQRNNTPSVQSRKTTSATTNNDRKNVKQRPKVSDSNNKQQTRNISTTPRGVTLSRSGTSTTPVKASTRRSVTNATVSSRNVRAAEVNEEKISDIKSRDISKCKTVYYDCMDEFCATKDTNLRRCACSSRTHEFDNLKKQLSAAETKMLDFNQRLLLVGMDKEDVAVVKVASEGEEGYSQADTSSSEKLLKKITDALNNSSDSKISNSLSPVSLSLDTDSAWDTIDSTSGISTSAKSGLELYNAVLPVCLEMAKEVCSEDEINIIQDNYKLAIQQDCNTVAKAYNTQYNNAIEKIHESGALLDMARLNAYQQRNSDDVLTCKKKILAQLSDASVCGTDLYKCLDISGQYINPADGSVFLSENLYGMTTLLTEPYGDQTWASMTQNSQFVSFLNSKKKFLQPAMEQCQDVADTVWTEFLSDALAQIKLAQNKKLEEVRQSCVTLVTECKTASKENLSEFDSRALSTFGVLTDTTVNQICADIELSCVSLMAASGGGSAQWQSGMDGISAETSYDTIIETCTTVGKDCIIQQCNGTSGNFGLCENFGSRPRRSILNRNVCWQEVLDCINQSSNLAAINQQITDETRENYYTSIYEMDATGFQTVPDICSELSEDEKKACYIAEQIWGNCENAPNSAITTNTSLIQSLNGGFISENKILTPISADRTTLLSWFATNTGTTDSIDGCSSYNCPVNYKYDNGTCKEVITSNNITTTNNVTISTTDQILYVSTDEPVITNDCPLGNAAKDKFGNCCPEHNGAAYVDNGICVHHPGQRALLIQEGICSTTNTNNSTDYYCWDGSNSYSLYCLTTVDENHHLPLNVTSDATTSIFSLQCDVIVLVDRYGNYIAPQGISNHEPYMYYNNNSQRQCRRKYINGAWGWYKDGSTTEQCDDGISPKPTNHHTFKISYQ